MQYYGGSSVLNISFLLVGFFLFLLLFVGGVSCVFYLYYARLWFVYFGRVSPWRFLWRAGSYFSICMRLHCVESRAGTIYLSASLRWVAELYRFSLLRLCCSGYGTIEMAGGWSVFHFTFFSVPSAPLAGGCLR